MLQNPFHLHIDEKDNWSVSLHSIDIVIVAIFWWRKQK